MLIYNKEAENHKLILLGVLFGGMSNQVPIKLSRKPSFFPRKKIVIGEVKQHLHLGVYIKAAEILKFRSIIQVLDSGRSRPKSINKN